MNEEPIPTKYIDIFTDSDWRAKLAPVVERARAERHAAIMQVIDLLESGGAVEDCDIERLYDALQSWIYSCEDYNRKHHISKNTFVIEGDNVRPLTYAELEQDEFARYGPAGKPPRPDAPAAVQQQRFSPIRHDIS